MCLKTRRIHWRGLSPEVVHVDAGFHIVGVPDTSGGEA
jgi:hypothetical protein